jgi:AcrR family transcriptional regulator
MAYRRTAEVEARLAAQRARIVAAATWQLADHGYTGCSIAAVARRAGVAPGTVYNHVDGKAELVAEVFRAVCGREVEAVRSAVAPTQGTAQRMTALVETFARRALKSPRLAYALLVEPVDPLVDRLRLQFRVAFRDIAADAIRAGVDAGDLPPQDPFVVAAAIVGAIGEALVGPLSSGTGASTVPELVGFVLRSIGVRDAVHT